MNRILVSLVLSFAFVVPVCAQPTPALVETAHVEPSVPLDVEADKPTTQEVAMLADEGLVGDYPDSHIVQDGDTLSQIAHPRLYNWPTRIAGIAAASGIADPDLIFPGQVIRLPAREKPEVSKVATPTTVDDTVVVDEGARAPSIGKVLVDTHSPRIRAERRAQEAANETIGGNDMSLEEARSLPETITLSDQFGSVVVPLRAAAIKFAEEAQASSGLDRSSFWTDGTSEQRPAPVDGAEKVIDEKTELDHLQARVASLERRVEDQDKRIDAQDALIKEFEERLGGSKGDFSFGLFVGTVQRWYASIGEDWRLWEWFVLGGVLALVISLGTVFFVQWYLDRQNAGQDPDVTVLMDQRNFLRRLISRFHDKWLDHIASKESGRVREDGLLARAEEALRAKNKPDTG